jgi:hypothetical protein
LGSLLDWLFREINVKLKNLSKYALFFCFWGQMEERNSGKMVELSFQQDCQHQRGYQTVRLQDNLFFVFERGEGRWLGLDN